MSVQTNQSKKQELKKYIIFVLMFLVFAASMWFIFGPSEKDKLQEKAQSGYNDKIPDPVSDHIADDKRVTYEQDWLKKEQDKKMKSLQDYSSYLGKLSTGKDSAKVDLMGDLSDNMSSREPVPQHSAIQSSVSSYHGINETLGSFYEEPGKDAEKEELKARLEELETKILEKDNEKNLVNEQLALMEKSYQMAAKYIPGSTGQLASEAGETGTAGHSTDKIHVQPVQQVLQNVVSILSAPVSNAELIKESQKPRNMGFVTVAGNESITNKNTIRASVCQTVTLADGQELQLRTTEPMQADNRLIPAGTILTGACRIGGDRLNLTVTSIQHAGNIIPVKLQVYDLDGQQGIFIPGSEEINAAKEIAANLASSTGSSITLSSNAGSQLAADLGRGLIQGTSGYVAKKMQLVKVTVKSGYQVLLLPQEK